MTDVDEMIRLAAMQPGSTLQYALADFLDENGYPDLGAVLRTEHGRRCLSRTEVLGRLGIPVGLHLLWAVCLVLDKIQWTYPLKDVGTWGHIEGSWANWWENPTGRRQQRDFEADQGLQLPSPSMRELPEYESSIAVMRREIMNAMFVPPHLYKSPIVHSVTDEPPEAPSGEASSPNNKSQ